MFSSKREVNDLIAIIDLQSSQVRISLIRYLPKTKPEIVFTNGKKIPFHVHEDSEQLIKKALESIKDLIHSALIFLKIPNHKVYGHEDKISMIHFVLSSPWAITHANTIRKSLPKKVQVTSKVLNDILEKDNNLLDPIYKLTDKGNIVVFEQKVFDVKLNGYTVTKWENLNANEISISFGMSVIARDMINSLRDTCQFIIPNIEMIFHSSLLTQYLGSKELLNDPAFYALVHIHGESTDVAIIEDHICAVFDHFPIGFNSVIRSLAHKTKSTIPNMDSLITLRLGGHIDAIHDKLSQKAIEEVSKVWCDEFLQIVKNVHPIHGFIPEILVSSRVHEDFFIKSLERATVGNKIGSLSLENIKEYISFGRRTEQSRSMGLYALAINILNSSQDIV